MATRTRAPQSDLPSTVKRSDEHAQAIYAETLASAERSYGPGERARRTAMAALKHSYEKVGDRWQPKEHRGPSDELAASGGPNARGRSAGGVDANASLRHLREVARDLDITGRSRMDRQQLVAAIAKANDRATRRARTR